MDGAEHKKTWYLMDGAEHRKTWYLMDGAGHSQQIKIQLITGKKFSWIDVSWCKVKTWYLMDGAKHSQVCARKCLG